MKCWICEINDADSGEHLVLHAILKEAFRVITQSKPAYFHSKKLSNLPVAAFNNSRFKFPKIICKDCNNNKTQKNDAAFITFFKYMQNHKRDILKKRKVNLNKIYKDEKISNASDLYIYFLKIYGCMLVADHKRLRDSHKWLQLRESILQSKILFNHVHVGIHIDYNTFQRESISFMPFIEKSYQGLMIDLLWFTVMLTYPFSPKGKKWGKPWNPAQSTNSVIKIGTFK